MDAEFLEGHWLACMASAGGGGRVLRLGHTLAVVNQQVPATFLNFLTFRGLAPAGLSEALEVGGAVLAGWGRAPAVYLSPAAGEMAALGDGFRRMGWRMITRQAVLVCDLPYQGADSPAPPPPDLRVERIQPNQVDLWGRVLVRAYGASPADEHEIGEGWASLVRAPGDGAQALAYLAYLDDAPVATGLLWLLGDAAGLYCGAVVPEFRRRGIERATVERRLADAAAAGARVALLQTEAGSPVAHLCTARLGFRLAYHRELWLPPPEPRSSL